MSDQFDFARTLESIRKDLSLPWYDRLCDQTLHVLGHRPTITPLSVGIPRNALIFNGKQPLLCHDHLQWEGPVLYGGTHYGGVLPGGVRYTVLVRQNLELDAHLLVYVTEAEVRAWCAEWYARPEHHTFGSDHLPLMECWKVYAANHIGLQK
jgi:hypothetical protein